MTRLLPPMNAIKPFVETAMLGSTVASASSLGRTHSAVSRQIKLLEGWLGVRLFERRQGGLHLTPKGAAYLQSAREALAILEKASEETMRTESDNLLRVACSPTFAKRWLLQRVIRFQKEHRDVDIRISSISESDSESWNFDIAVVNSPPEGGQIFVDPFMADLVFLVGPATDDRAIAGAATKVLIKTGERLPEEERWKKTVFSAQAFDSSIRVEDFDVAVAAAANGQGVFVVSGISILDDLRHRKLAACTGEAVQIDVAYWTLRPKAAIRRTLVKLFLAFLRAEAMESFEDLKNRYPYRIVRAAGSAGRFADAS